jgi:Domain of unknown function (DUF4190)
MDEGTRGPAVHDGYAITTLVLGLCGWGTVGSVLAAVFGALSEVEAHRQGRKASGLALAGQVLGVTGIVGLALILRHL